MPRVARDDNKGCAAITIGFRGLVFRGPRRALGTPEPRETWTRGLVDPTPPHALAVALVPLPPAPWATVSIGWSGRCLGVGVAISCLYCH